MASVNTAAIAAGVVTSPAKSNRTRSNRAGCSNAKTATAAISATATRGNGASDGIGNPSTPRRNPLNDHSPNLSSTNAAGPNTVHRTDPAAKCSSIRCLLSKCGTPVLRSALAADVNTM